MNADQLIMILETKIQENEDNRNDVVKKLVEKVYDTKILRMVLEDANKHYDHIKTKLETEITVIDEQNKNY